MCRGGANEELFELGATDEQADFPVLYGSGLEGWLVRDLEFAIPTRGLIISRTEFLTGTRGYGVMAAHVSGYRPWAGDVGPRSRESLASMEAGTSTGYSLENLQTRGNLFLSPGERVYRGMIIGEHSRPEDLACSPTKTKELGNYRSETKDIDVGFKVPRRLSLDQALEWIAADELVEVTPGSIRMRNAILDAEERKRRA